MVQFICEHCRREVSAPDEAGGKRGKCSYCKQSSYIPMPKSDEDGEIALAPVDDEVDPQQREELAALKAMEKLILEEDAAAPPPAVPVEHRDDVRAEDVSHHVVNYCLDMASSNLARAATHVARLKGFGYAGIEAADDFLSGKVLEPSLDTIPVKVLHGFLEQLKSSIRGG